MLSQRFVPVGAISFVCLALAPVHATHVIVVAPTGGQFTQIQPAIDSAANGHTILVKAGTYGGFSIVNRARLDVVADAGANVQIQGRVLVQDCPGYIVLSGLNVNAQDVADAADRHALTLTNNTGPMRVVGCNLTGPPPQTGQQFCKSGYGAIVSGSSDVEFVACVFQGSQISLLGGSPGLSCSDSSVALYDSSLNGGDSTCYSCGNVGAQGGDGAIVSNGFLFASRCDFNGGDGANGPDLTDGGNGGAGLRVNGAMGTASLLDCITVGGSGGIGTHWLTGMCCGFNCLGAYDGNPGPPTVGGATIQFLPGFGRTLTVPRVVRELQPFHLQIGGQPNEGVYLYLSGATGFQWQPAFSGVALSSLIYPPQLLRIGNIGSSGMLNHPFAFPDVGPGVISQTWHMQTLHRNLQGKAVLGSGRTMVVLDSSL